MQVVDIKIDVESARGYLSRRRRARAAFFLDRSLGDIRTVLEALDDEQRAVFTGDGA